jgi:hypothetical protein
LNVDTVNVWRVFLSGITNGGYPLSIFGRNFGTKGPVVTLGASQCVVTAFNHTYIRCIAPPGAGSGVPVRVTVSQQTTPPELFDYDRCDQSSVSWRFAFDVSVWADVLLWCVVRYRPQVFNVTPGVFNPSLPLVTLNITGANFGPYSTFENGVSITLIANYSSQDGVNFRDCLNPSYVSHENIGCQLAGPVAVGTLHAVVTVVLQSSAKVTGAAITGRCSPGDYGDIGEFCLRCVSVSLVVCVHFLFRRGSTAVKY